MCLWLTLPTLCGTHKESESEEEGEDAGKPKQVETEKDTLNGAGLREGIGATPYIIFYRRRGLAS